MLSFHSRGCYSLDRNNYDGAANMCPRHLKKLVQALDRLTIPSVKDVIKVALFDDTAQYRNAGAKVFKKDKDKYRCDLADKRSYKLFWEHNYKIFFSTVPRKYWFFLNGKVVITTWSMKEKWFKNMKNNCRKLLDYLKGKFKSTFNVDVAFVL